MILQRDRHFRQRPPMLRLERQKERQRLLIEGASARGDLRQAMGQQVAMSSMR